MDQEMTQERAPWRPPRASSQASGPGGVNEGEPKAKQPRKQEEKPEGKRVRRGGKKRNAEKGSEEQRQLVTKDRGLRKLLVALLKSHLMTCQNTRLLMAACDVFLLQADHMVTVAVREEGAAFAKAVAEWREKKRQAENQQGAQPPKAWGSPAPTLFLAMVEALMKQDMGGKNKKELTEAMPELSKPEWVEKRVHAVKVKDAREEGKVLITISMAGFKYQDLIVRALEQSGAEHKTGVAPAGYLEEELSAWCEELAKTLD